MPDELKEWLIEYNVEVEVAFTRIVVHTGAEVFEAATSEEAVAMAKREFDVPYFSRLNIDGGISDEDFSVTVNADTFKTEAVTELSE